MSSRLWDSAPLRLSSFSVGLSEYFTEFSHAQRGQKIDLLQSHRFAPAICLQSTQLTLAGIIKIIHGHTALEGGNQASPCSPSSSVMAEEITFTAAAKSFSLNGDLPTIFTAYRLSNYVFNLAASLQIWCRYAQFSFNVHADLHSGDLHLISTSPH